MIDIALALLAVMAPAGLVKPDASRLQPGDRCYAMELQGEPVGETRQVIRADRRDGRAVWDVVVHQRVPSRRFDLRDHFVLAKRDLAPLAFDSRKLGVEHVRLRYDGNHVSGVKIENGMTTPIDLTTRTPIWEGNLWGVTFGALPLKQGVTFTLPFYQYDKGIGSFTLTVTGSETVTTPDGSVDAWVIDAGTDPKRRSTYLIGKRDGWEVATRAGPFTTRLGGDCTGLE